MSEQPLFRPQAQNQNNRTSTVLSPLIQTSPLAARLGALLALLFVALLSLLLLLKYRETAAARGVIEDRGGTVDVVSPEAARLTRILVSPGDTVSAGQILAILDKSRFSTAGQPLTKVEGTHLRTQLALQQEQLQLLHRQQAQRADRLQRRLAAQQYKLELIESEAQLLRKQLQLNAGNLQAVEQVAAANGIAKAQLAREQFAHLELQRSQQLLQRDKQEIVAVITDLQQQLTSQSLEFQSNQLLARQRISELEYRLQSTEEEDHRAVVADRDGIVASVALTAGDAVHINQPILTLRSAGSALQGTVYVPSRIADRLEQGQAVLLRFDGYDYRYHGRFPATVAQLSNAPLDPRQTPLPVPGIQEPVYKVVVTIDPAMAFSTAESVATGRYPTPRLQNGSAFSADFVLAEKRLISFIFEPLLALRGKLS